MSNISKKLKKAVATHAEREAMAVKLSLMMDTVETNRPHSTDDRGWKLRKVFPDDIILEVKITLDDKNLRCMVYVRTIFVNEKVETLISSCLDNHHNAWRIHVDYDSDPAIPAPDVANYYFEASSIDPVVDVINTLNGEFK